MIRRVFLHIGLPKTGTTYLQSIAWSHQEQLLEHGLLLPGFGPRQHLWASGVVRGEPRLERRHPNAPHAWSNLLSEVAKWPATTLISHEFFCGADREQAAAAVTDLNQAGADEVHLVVTCRELVELVTARWQEWIKNGATGSIDSYPPSAEFRPEDEWGWGTLDLAEVLDRWAAGLHPERVHVICPPGGSSRPEALWRTFAGIIGVADVRVDTTLAQANPGLGVVQVETLRRINPHLTTFRRPVDRGVWIRRYLAEGVLAPLGGEPFWPNRERVAELRERSRIGLERVASSGYDVHGSLDRLRTPDHLPPRRHPTSVTDAEVAEVAVSLVARLLEDVRDRTSSDAGRGGSPHPGADSRIRRLARRVQVRASRASRR